MITSLEISGLRGIREGKLDGLTPLTILVGPNGCGKSTVLDALLIGASDPAQNALQRVAWRHKGLWQNLRWLLWRAEKGETAVVTTRNGSNLCHSYELHAASPQQIQCRLHEPIQQETEGRKRNPRAVVASVNSIPSEPRDKVLSPIRLLERLTEITDPPLHVLVTESYKRGRRGDIAKSVAKVVPGVRDVLILTEGDRPVVHLEYETHTVPVDLAGDGIHSLVRIFLELASSQRGLVLMEEPEAQQHPAAMHQTARAVVNAVREGTQVVLTTHSLELIDSFLAESSPEDIDRLSLYRLQLTDGKLIAVSVPGRDVAFARGQIEEDLR